MNCCEYTKILYFKTKVLLVTHSPFHPSQLFVSKGGAYPSGGNFTYIILSSVKAEANVIKLFMVVSQNFLNIFVISQRVCPWKAFSYPSLMFASKAKSLSLSGAPFRCFTWVGSGLICKHQTRLERLARDKRSNLLRKFVTYGRKKFYNIDQKTLQPVHLRVRLGKHFDRTRLRYTSKKCFISEFLRNTSLEKFYIICQVVMLQLIDRFINLPKPIL